MDPRLSGISYCAVCRWELCTECRGAAGGVSAAGAQWAGGTLFSYQWEYAAGHIQHHGHRYFAYEFYRAYAESAIVDAGRGKMEGFFSRLDLYSAGSGAGYRPMAGWRCRTTLYGAAATRL